MIFYPNEQCLSYAEKVVTEIEKILKNPKKTIENSFLKKYVSVLEKGQCDDFLKMSIDEYQFLRKGYPRAMMGTCLLYTSPSPRDATLSRMPSSA